MTHPIRLPFGTTLELLDPLERSPYLTCASPIHEPQRVLSWLHASFAGDPIPRSAVIEEARRLGLRGDASSILRQVAVSIARGDWGIASGADVVPPVRPDNDADWEDFDTDDVEAWSVFGLEWGARSATCGTDVAARASTAGVPDGLLAHIEVHLRGAYGGPSRSVGSTSAIVRGGRVEASWLVEFPWDRATLVPAYELPPGVTHELPQFYFTVRVRGRTFGAGEISGLLALLDDVEVAFADLDHSPLATRAYRATLADGSVREGKLASGAVLRLTSVAPGPILFEFERHAEEY
jgi:hypothetical protein